MSESKSKQDIESLAKWRETFLEAAVAHSRGSRRRWGRRAGIAAVAAALVGTGGVAVAALTDDSSDPAPLETGGTVGYINLATGEPITCPDGEPLTYSANLPATDLDATCSDGSVPKVFTEQSEALERWLLNQPSETSLEGAPTFSYSIPGGQ